MGPRKGGVNEKAEAARARKVDAKASKAAAEAASKEDAAWAAHANPVHKRDMKREEQERKAAEVAARKAEARRLLAEEEANLIKKKDKPERVGKVTAHQLALMKEAERKQAEKDDLERQMSMRREVTEDAQAALLEVQNVNREEGVVLASGVDAALSVLSVGAASPADRHPEKRAKAAWEAFYARRLEEMKQDKPGLRAMQYKSKIFDEWQRSPLNPRNLPPQQQ